ncbi:Uncharacterized protein OBRU01_19289 [Operophtera brumata]|uniref:MD-2-related lipid-recognition domain-containing protein n=1 Tax=Operophtera brumata TaxID=104452 RepID=A0A0L7KXF3_OPEBR|nr:Uncharacterized protein OBRU01_19289 [Operophtera brumata]
MLLWVLLLLRVTSVVSSVVFEDCGSAYDLYAVNIEGCGMRLPCYVTLGEEVPVNLEFRAEQCDSVVCPVQTDGLTSFYSVMTVPANMALNQRGFLRWRIYNERGVRVLCYSVLVQTQSYLQKRMRSQYHFIDHT